MHRHFEEVEKELLNRLLYMGSLAEEMIHLAVEGLEKRAEEPLKKVAANEEQVNNLHIELDDRCLKLLALHQPAAGDLRFIMAAIKINSDLERIADQAVNISENAAVLLSQPPLQRKLLNIPRMAVLAQGMLKDSLDSLVKKDVNLARSVVGRDDEEDKLKGSAFTDLMELMQSDSSTIQRALGLILIARNIERIADHATNVAEDVIFMVLGKDIRHHAQ
ncbi:MAG: phosphate transport system regulatory protein PhoU [Elusimicrobia bacterium RIFCSPHIGHO2_02_FULL_57_9]|nr:MAG: phosphate transport system regulatory protein PhoU [Elusimicrobia bacterium RIFCSPHIGHO2_02_FULL_57_9]